MKVWVIVAFILLIFPISLAYDSLTSYMKVGVPSSISDGTELNSSQYAQINVSDDTRLISNTTGNSIFDSQIFIFNMSSDILGISYLDSINFTWEGYGENSTGYYTNISVWNWSNSQWYKLNSTDFVVKSDQTLNLGLSSGLSDFVNSTTKEVGFLVVSEKNPCGVNHTYNGDGSCSAILRPNANGDLLEWALTAPVEADSYTTVDDVVPDGDSSYVASYAQSIEPPKINISMKENSYVSNTTISSITSAYAYYTTKKTTRPSGGAWTTSDVDSLQIGMRAIPILGDPTLELFNLEDLNAPAGATVDVVAPHIYARWVLKNTDYRVRVSQVYAQVNYTLASVNNVLYTDYVNLSVYNEANPPLISMIRNVTTDSGATISWTTDEGSNSSVNYGGTLSLGSISSLNDNVTSHSISLTSLTSNTLYYYNITSCDLLGNCNTSGSFNFTTASPSNADSTGTTNRFYQKSSPSGNLELYLSLKAGKEKQISIDDQGNFGIKNILIKAKKLLKGDIEITKVPSVPLNCINNQDYVLYKGYNIAHERIDNEDIEKVVLRVGVDKDWLSENEIVQIQFLKCNGEISFNKVENLDQEYLYDLESDGFSEWFIVGYKDVVLEDVEIIEEPVGEVVLEKSPFHQDTKSSIEDILISIFLVMGTIGYVSFYLYKDIYTKKHR